MHRDDAFTCSPRYGVRVPVGLPHGASAASATRPAHNMNAMRSKSRYIDGRVQANALDVYIKRIELAVELIVRKSLIRAKLELAASFCDPLTN